MIKHLFVTAALAREVPIPTSEATAPGGELLRCLPGKVYRLPNTTYTRKRLASGDLLLCDRAGKLVDSHERAAAHGVHELDHTGAVEQVAPAAPAPATPPATDAKGL